MGRHVQKCLGRSWLAVAVVVFGCGGPPVSESPDAQTGHPDGGTELVITPAALSPATVGRTYEQTLSVSGGRAPYVWSLTADPELDWLTIDAQGVLRDDAPPSDIPEEALGLRVAVIDADGLTASREYSLTVSCEPGRVLSCFHAQGEACVTGERQCVGGQLTACESVGGLAYSTRLSACGGSCSPCDPALATACRDGKCACGSAPACSSANGTTCCGADAAASCVRLSESVSHCGSCGRDCAGSAELGAKQNVAPGCSSSQCTFACQPGYRSCDGAGESPVGADANGCETELLSNLEHCGACSVSCTDQAVGRQNVAVGCGQGQCSFQCRPAFGNCTPGAGSASVGEDADGCETSLTTLQNCGACGQACSVPANGEAVCLSTGCDISCRAGYLKCGGQCVLNGTSNCNACGKVCTAPANGTPFCSSTGCGFSCRSGYVKCDGQCFSGAFCP